MQVIRETTEFIIEHDTAVTIGKFDGLHIGHQKILNKLQKAGEEGLQTVVFTFDPPPSVFFAGGLEKDLTTKEEKRVLFAKMGIDILIEFPLNQKTAAIPPEQFITEVLIRQLHMKKIVAGDDISFGSRRQGNSQLLEAYSKCYGYETCIISKVIREGLPVSSSRIREALAAGDVGNVRRLLGEPYFIMGVVVYGNQVGRTIGIPTVNLVPQQDKLLPPNGVYFSHILLAGKQYRGITNIGRKPTVSETSIQGVETHIFDFDENIYGKEVTVQFLFYKRPEKKFSSLKELQEALETDIRECRAYFG